MPRNPEQENSLRRVPASIMVLSIIGIVFAALGFLGSCFAGIMLFTSFIHDPNYDALRDDPLYFYASAVGLGIGLVLMILLLAASIGSLQLRPWARKTMLVYAVLAVVQIVLSTAFHLIYTMPRMTTTLTGPAARAGYIGGMIGAVFGLLFNLGWLGCVFFFYTRPRARDAFNGVFPADPTAFPLDEFTMSETPTHFPPA